MTARFSSDIQLQMPCRQMLSNSGESVRVQKSAKFSSVKRALAPDTDAKDFAKAACDGLKSVAYQVLPDAAAWILAFMPCL